MTINLPPNIEAIAKEKAALAGLSDVDTFVQRIIENAPPEQALLPPSDPSILAAINEGFDSRVKGVMDQAFWQECGEKLESYIAARDDLNN